MEINTVYADCSNFSPPTGGRLERGFSVLFNITQLQYINACEKGDNSAGQRLAYSKQTADVVANVIKLFPNPTNGTITFETADDLTYNLSVYNLLGEKVLESTITNKQTINLNNLSSATYIVHIHHNGSLIKTERISIIH